MGAPNGVPIAVSGGLMFRTARTAPTFAPLGVDATPQQVVERIAAVAGERSAPVPARVHR